MDLVLIMAIMNTKKKLSRKSQNYSKLLKSNNAKTDFDAVFGIIHCTLSTTVVSAMGDPFKSKWPRWEIMSEKTLVLYICN